MSPLRRQDPSEIRVVAGVERTVAERTVLSLEMARVILTFRVGMYVSSGDSLLDPVLNAFHGKRNFIALLVKIAIVYAGYYLHPSYKLI